MAADMKEQTALRRLAMERDAEQGKVRELAAKLEASREAEQAWLDSWNTIRGKLWPSRPVSLIEAITVGAAALRAQVDARTAADNRDPVVLAMGRFALAEARAITADPGVDALLGLVTMAMGEAADNG
jgi:hypothetical protein